MTLQLYFARRFLAQFLAVTAALLVILGLVDLMDELGDYPDLGLGAVIGLVLLKLPEAYYEMLPLAVVLSSVALFLRLARSSELVVVRAAGRSALRGLLAPVLLVLVIGLVGLSVGNPIVAATAKRYHDLSNRYSGTASSDLAIASEGLWLRQASARGQTVIFAAHASSDLTSLFRPTFLDFDPQGQPVRRVTAALATLSPQGWQLSEVKIWDLATEANPEASARELTRMTVPSELTRDRILDSFGDPGYIPIWELPRFVERLERAGLSARRYAIWLQTEMAQPIFLVALVLIAAAFTMRHPRGGHVGLAVLSAILLGFALHYIRNFATILAENGQIPILMAAWAPPLAALFLGLGILLHMEDG